MADDVDIANDRAALEVQAALSRITTKPQFVATGQCLNCEAELDPDQKLNDERFCDSHCAEDHAFILKRQKQL